MSLWFFVSFVMPASIGLAAYLYVLWNEHQDRKQDKNQKPGE